MKKIVSIISAVLLLCVAVTFVACNDKGGGSTATPIVLTDGMTAEDILALLPQIQNITCEEDGTEGLLNKSGQIYYFNPGEANEIWYVCYIANGQMTEIAWDVDDNGCYMKFINYVPENEADSYYDINRYVDMIKHCLENDGEWRIEDGKLVIGYDDEWDGYRVLKFSNINSTEVNFDYYLAMDLPVYNYNK